MRPRTIPPPDDQPSTSAEAVSNAAPMDAEAMLLVPEAMMSTFSAENDVQTQTDQEAVDATNEAHGKESPVFGTTDAEQQDELSQGDCGQAAKRGGVKSGMDFLAATHEVVALKKQLVSHARFKVRKDVGGRATLLYMNVKEVLMHRVETLWKNGQFLYFLN
ncbi:hypothetical protein GPALN_011908 [Globodera pallida]|nr:hypothetical protein GPALN_011908 [Globodera pallida]